MTVSMPILAVPRARRRKSGIASPTDLLRIVSQMGSLARASDRVAWGYVSAADALAVLNSCILTLAALRGIEGGNITRGPGWHFLNIGRRIERSFQLIELIRSIVVPIDPEDWPSLEMLLEVADSSITYRSRYFTVLQAAPVVDLLMNDAANPRSLAFQLKDLARHCSALSGMPSGSGWPVVKQRQMEAAAAQLLQADGAISLRNSDGSQPHQTGQSARGSGYALALLSRSHLQHLLQPRRNGARHLMLYRVRHQTIYDYVQPVSVSHHVVRLTPRDLRGQRRRVMDLSVWPVPPSHATTHIDYFGNTVTSFTLPESHSRMSVEAISELEVEGAHAPRLFGISGLGNRPRHRAGRLQSGGPGGVSVRLRLSPRIGQAGAGCLRQRIISPGPPRCWRPSST